MSVIPITVYGDKILKEKTKKINSVNDVIIKNIRDMFETMRRADGIGLAANQVGLNKSLFIIDLSGIDGYDNFKPLVMINPQIVDHSEESVIMEEGCLSLPLLRADVERPEIIKVSYLDTDEEERELEADSWLARVILHEYDHLIGKMIPDRVTAEIKKELQSELIKIKKREVDIDYTVTSK